MITQHTKALRGRLVFAVICLVAASVVEAKGYTPKRAGSVAESQKLEGRVSRVEEQQKRLEDALTTELKQLRTELKDVQAHQQLANAGKPAAD